MRRWAVASGIIEDDDRVLLVANRRRNGSIDWTPPGGVIDDGEHEVEALSREVLEETGLRVVEWAGPVYGIRVQFAELEWDLRVVVYRAVRWTGEITIGDPDGIVQDARFLAVADTLPLLQQSPQWVRDPFSEWMLERWDVHRQFHFDVAGTHGGPLVVSRIDI
jgi:8-oxo-dGTP diphosphatase